MVKYHKKSRHFFISPIIIIFLTTVVRFPNTHTIRQRYIPGKRYTRIENSFMLHFLPVSIYGFRTTLQYFSVDFNATVITNGVPSTHFISSMC